MSIQGGSIFKGISSVIQPSAAQRQTKYNNLAFFIGHVLSSPEYNGDDFGKITVRLINTSTTEDESLITQSAYPIDLNNVKLPLPGELVLIVEGVGNVGHYTKNRFAAKYYYINTLTFNDSITYNSDPYVGLIYKRSEVQVPLRPEFAEETRFENQLASKDSFINYIGQKEIRERKRLIAYEGDHVLQSRFGSTIRLGSSNPSSDNVWSRSNGVAGNPITIVSATRDVGYSNNTLDRVEDINKDDSSIYLCTTQVIPIDLSVSSELKSLRHIYNIPLGDSITNTQDITSFVETPEEEALFYSDDDTVATDLSVYDFYGRDIPAAADITIYDEVPGIYLDNNKSSIKLIQVDGKPLQLTIGKVVLAMKLAAERDGISLLVTSGFRPAWENLSTKSAAGVAITAQSQSSLRKQNLKSSYVGTVDPLDAKIPSSYFSPPTAPPGVSSHGSGLAVDFNTGSRKYSNSVGSLNVQVYKWLIKNAHLFGFVRTVSDEEWHFEFRMPKAAKGPYGAFEKALKDEKARDTLLFYKDLDLDKIQTA